MRAVKYGVTRRHVLGLEAVLASGEVLRTGGKILKESTGYDLTQLIIGSEGTLALVTEATVRLYPRLTAQATVLAPFASLAQVTAAVPGIVASGIGPLILEYLDVMAMSVITQNEDIDLPIPAAIRDATLAYLVVMLEERSEERLAGATEETAELLTTLGAPDVYVLPPGPRASSSRRGRRRSGRPAAPGPTTSWTRWCRARPWRASWPRWPGSPRATAGWRSAPGTRATATSTWRCSSPTPGRAAEMLRGILAAAVARGGAISGEHGIGARQEALLPGSWPIRSRWT